MFGDIREKVIATMQRRYADAVTMGKQWRSDEETMQ
jgi:hypothetical protein